MTNAPTGAWTVCDDPVHGCGSVIADEAMHALWHLTLTQTTKRAS